MSDVRKWSFEKVQGLGNDFVLVDLRGGGEPMSTEIAVAVCDRRRGVGADGVLTLLPARGEADLALLIQNADGSVPEMCGNGLRCVVSVVRDDQPGGPVRVETGAGLRLGRVRSDGLVEVTLGVGRIVRRDVPVELVAPPREPAPEPDPSLVGERELGSIGPETSRPMPPVGLREALRPVALEGVEVDMGNPHLVLFVEGAALRGRPLAELADTFGPELERHPDFPRRVNVGFARPGPDEIELVVFERGVGRTLACGTGAGACALAAHHTGRWARPGAIPVRLPGGPLLVEVPTPGRPEVHLVGPAVRVFRGELSEADLELSPRRSR